MSEEWKVGFLDKESEFVPIEDFFAEMEEKDRKTPKFVKWFWEIRYKIKNFFRYEIKYAWQRIFRGYDDNATWNFCHHITKIGVPILQSMIDDGYSYPADFEDKSEWDNILNEIKWSFENMDYMNSEFFTPDDLLEGLDKYKEKHQRGIDLFAEYFDHLWD